MAHDMFPRQIMEGRMAFEQILKIFWDIKPTTRINLIENLIYYEQM